MADATTTRYAFVKPEVGASADTWGTKLNTVFDDADALLGAITTTGSSNAYVLTTGLSLASYVTGQTFTILASFSNSSTVTINVDSLGAKAITKNGTTALASGDIVSGNIYTISYDGTRFQLVGTTGTGVYQPVDADLTAISALSYTSGNMLLQKTAADTWSVTLTPSVSSVTASQGAAATTPSATFVNTTDNASVRVARFEGDRATMATSDEAYVSMYLSDSAGNQDEFARITWQGASITNGAENGAIQFSLLSAGSLSARALLGTGAFRPTTNDLLTLGTSSFGWADYFGATGHTFNLGNGNVVLTHSTGLLSVTTGDFQANLPLSTETTGTLTVASANKHILATGGITLPNSVFAARNITTIDGNGTSRTITRGSGVTMYVNGTDSATATLTSNGLMAVYWRTASICILKGDVS